MKWRFPQPLLSSGAHESLAPSLTGMGPNVYLGRRDFLKMMGVALVAHLIVFGIAGLFPHMKVTNIPVRALSFKLGDQDRVAALGGSMPNEESVAPPPMVAAPVMSASMREEARIKPIDNAPVIKWKPAPVIKSTKAAIPSPMTHPVATPAIAPAPQQYVREVGQPAAASPLPAVNAGAGIATGAANGAGLENMQSEQTAQAIRERYEQQISSWIERHKFYPAEAGGREGRVVVRMRIDREGTVRYYAIEESSGLQAIDLAAIDMVRRANPVPAVPANYPSGNLIEFLIPITFRAPQ